MQEVKTFQAVVDNKAAKIASWEFMRCYVTTMRPYLLFVSGITGIVGLALSPMTAPIQLISLSVVFFLSYGFGQALTDCFQMDTDSISSPYRPLVQGRVRRRDIAIVSLAGLGISGAILFWAAKGTLFWAALATVGLATYTYFKRRWWSGPFYNALIVTVLCYLGYISGYGGTALFISPAPAMTATLLCVFFGYANFVLSGYFKDISADNATGYNTMPVVFGLKISAIISDIFALFSTASAWIALYYTIQSNSIPFTSWYWVPLALAGLFTAILAQTRLHGVTDEKAAYRAIELVVHSYILSLGAIAAASRPGWILPILVFYGGFLLAMRLRPAKEQI